MSRGLRLAADDAGALTVVSAAALISVTVAVLPVALYARVIAWGVALTLVLLAGPLYTARIASRHRLLTLVYPALTCGALALMGSKEHLLGLTYSGIFVVCFAYIGLYAAPRSAPPFAVPAALCWWTANGGFGHGVSTGVLGVRLVIALSIWVGLAELLARHVRDSESEQRRLSDVAERDPLTNLYNRRALVELFATCAPGDAFALVDFDRFKLVNDQHGHAAGDRVLSDFAQLLDNQLRACDLAVRYGGEEILVYLSQTGDVQTGGVLARLRESWRQDRPLTTYSAGAAVMGEGETPEAVIARADSCLYDAKSGGRDRDVLEGADDLPRWVMTGDPQLVAAEIPRTHPS